MSLKTRQISKDNYRTTIVWLEESLTEMGATKEEIFKGEFLLEETLLRLVNASADKEKFEGRLSIRKRFGDISISVSARGGPLIHLCLWKKSPMMRRKCTYLPF